VGRWILLCLALVGTYPFPGSLRAQVASQPATTLTPEDQAQIIKWINEGDKALQANDLETAEKLYRQVLAKNPYDPVAREQLQLVASRKEEAAKKNSVEVYENRERHARDKQVQDAIRKASERLDLARQSGSRQYLDEARAARDEARKIAGTVEYPELTRLDAGIETEASHRRTLQWEYWGGIGIVSVAVLAGLVVYFWRRRHVLEMIQGPQPGQLFVLRQDLTRVGALADQVDWVITDPLRKVSRHHCDVIRSRRHYFVVDRSTNGTFLNGQPLSRGEPVLLRRGDLLNLGSEITLRFQ
jgi:hypothetical protein